MREMLYDRVAMQCAKGKVPSSWNNPLIVRLEISNVRRLMGDYGDLLKPGLICRPPDDFTWFEWSHAGVPDMPEVTTGCILKRVGSKPYIFNENVRGETSEEYVAHPVINRIDRARRGFSAGLILLNTVNFVFSLNYDGSLKSWNHGPVDEDMLSLLRFAYNIDAVWRPSSLGLSSEDTFPWPAIYACALLHCRNIVTEEVHPDNPHPKKWRERGYPPKCTYKVLKIEVPASIAKRQAAAELGGDDSGPKVRFHLCRGHFATMQHERFKNRGGTYWIPAHWRGSKDLGVVVKDYRPVPAAIPGTPQR